MSGRHLTEDMLQQYALRPAECPEETVTHLFECGECRAAVSAYEHVVDALKEQAAPAFAFDLAAAVTAQLETEAKTVEPATSGSRLLTFLIPVVIAVMVSIPAWLFRKTAYFLFDDMTAGCAGIILGTAGIALLLALYKYYRRYQQVLHLINE